MDFQKIDVETYFNIFTYKIYEIIALGSMFGRFRGWDFDATDLGSFFFDGEIW
jgi:hypothetical protein